MSIGKHLIAGAWIESEKTFTNTVLRGKPRDFSVGTAKDVDAACQAAEKAFYSYSVTTSKERASFLEKIADEIELTRGFVIDAGVAKPRINYSLARSDEAELKARYVYELTIRPPGLEPFAKLVTLSLRSTVDGWRVTNYSESDP